MAFTLKAPCTYQEEIRKSRFLALAAPVSSAAEAQAFIQRASDPSASHNCWAWKVGNQYRSSDDGEPGGTAGRPMLAAIEGQGFDRVAVVVTRWYGGIQLGTGGLARAYGGSTEGASGLLEQCRQQAHNGGGLAGAVIPSQQVDPRRGFETQRLQVAHSADAEFDQGHD